MRNGTRCCDHTCDDEPTATSCCGHACTVPAAMPLVLVRQGDDLVLPCQALNADGTPINLTGTTIAATVRAANGVPMGAFTVAITNALLGQYTLTMPRAQTALWAEGMARFVIEYTDAGNLKTTTPQQGYIELQVVGAY